MVAYFEFWRECRSGGNKFSNVRSFIILLSGEGLTSFCLINRTNFFGEKKENGSFPGCLLLSTRVENFS